MPPAKSTLLDTFSTSLVPASLLYLTCAMCDTNSSLNSSIGTPLVATTFHHSAMCNTNSTLLGLIGTPFMTASFYFPRCTMCDANSSAHDVFGTSLMTASFYFHLCAMCNTNSSVHDVSGTPLVATTFPLYRCTMSDTNSSLNGFVIHPSWLHFFLTLTIKQYARRDYWSILSFLLLEVCLYIDWNLFFWRYS